ncbi:MAG: PEGA domain-containing protein [Candidatus Krumholzibacteriota bacterium]|nr:PEGA domain-containing protein [Candidatus Krumholzibacteriota bacterium]
MMEQHHFQSIPNPYIVGNPIDDKKMFFGREDDFEYIRKKITGTRKGGMLVLCGTRRSGKTSILFQIRGGRLGREYLPVLIDMQSVAVQNDAEFLEKLARAITAVVGEPAAETESRFLDELQNNPFSAFQNFTAGISGRLDGKKLILLFDEYELFESLIDKGRFSTEVLTLLAAWMESHAGVFYIFTGSDKLESRNHRYWGAFLGKALHRRIGFLSRNDTLRLIREPVQGLVEYAPDVPEAIFRLTAGQPFYSQVLCQSLVDHLNEKEKHRVTEEDLHQVVDEIIENPLPQMIFSWSSLSRLEKINLSLIAELSREKAEPVDIQDIIALPSEEKIGYEIDGNKLRETTERLFLQDHLEKDESGNHYFFKMDLWRRWMLRMHSIWQVIDEIGGEEFSPDEGIVPVKRGRSRVTAVLVTTAVVVSLALLTLYLNQRSQPRTDFVPLAVDSTFITVRTDPPEASLFLGDLRIGKSPLQRKRVPAGRTLLRIELAGYRPYADSLLLLGEIPLEKAVSLEEITGNLRVTSEPAGARIFLNGQDAGKTTPGELTDLSVNRTHHIRVSLKGYSDGYFGNVQIEGDSTLLINHSFMRRSHQLTIISEPTGAKIYIDGSYEGTTPLFLSGVLEGRHQLELKKPGFQDLQSYIDVPAPGNHVSMGLTSLPPAEVIFQITPYATLYINGQLKYEGQHYSIFLNPGIYTIDLRHPEYGNLTDTLEVLPGQVITQTYRLDRKE